MTSVRVDIDGFIGVVTIDRPEFMNALNVEVLTELIEACRTLEASEVRCAVITGAGTKAFAAGADIAAMVTMTQAQATEFSALGNRAFRTIEKLSIPTIAAVNGFALGGGCELALACDMRYASESAVFGQPEVGLGIPPGFGATQRLAKVIGTGQAKEMMYASSKLDAGDALRLGLVNRVVHASELMEETTSLAARIAANSPNGVQATKKAVDMGSQVDLVTGADIESLLFGSCFERDDQRQAMAAFIKKERPAPFTGR